MVKRWLIPFAAGVLCAACSDATGDQVVIGTIDAGGTLGDVIVGPASGSVAERLSFTVSTFGNSCVAAAGAQVVIRDLQATVTPLDRESRTGNCLDYLRAYPRSVTVTFLMAGDATIRVEGRSFYQSGLVTVEHHVRIEP